MFWNKVLIVEILVQYQETLNNLRGNNGVFSGNLHHIETADFVLVNTRDKDIGTIWESGYAYAHKKPIVYFCGGLPKGAKFNLMLARSGVKVCTNFEQLEDYLV